MSQRGLTPPPVPPSPSTSQGRCFLHMDALVLSWFSSISHSRTLKLVGLFFFFKPGCQQRAKHSVFWWSTEVREMFARLTHFPILHVSVFFFPQRLIAAQTGCAFCPITVATFMRNVNCRKMDKEKNRKQKKKHITWLCKSIMAAIKSTTKLKFIESFTTLVVWPTGSFHSASDAVTSCFWSNDLRARSKPASLSSNTLCRLYFSACSSSQHHFASINSRLLSELGKVSVPRRLWWHSASFLRRYCFRCEKETNKKQ